MNRLMTTRIACLLMALTASISAQESTSSAPAEVIPVTETEALVAREGQPVRVRGYVETARVNATGIHFLNFRDTGFVCVTFPRNLARFSGGLPAERYGEKWVELTGTLELYRGDPQIKLEDPSQIAIVEAPPEAPEPIASAEEPTHSETTQETNTPGESAPVAPPEPGAELVNGQPPVDWRRFFPPAKEEP